MNGSEKALGVVAKHKESLARDVLATSVAVGASPEAAERRQVDVEGENVELGIERA